MACVKYLSFLLVLAVGSLVQSKMCDLDDVECQTRGADKAFRSILTGANGLMEPLDSIHIENIAGDLAGLKFKITNGTMTELNSCNVAYLKCDKEDLTFVYHLYCPQLVIYIRDEFKGMMDSVSLDGITEEKITMVDYLMKFNGNYVLSVSEKDKKPRGIIKNYVLDTEVKGKVIFKNLKLIRGDRNKMEAAYEYANKNGIVMEKLMKTPVIDAFMNIYMDKVNAYLKEFPLEDVLSQE